MPKGREREASGPERDPGRPGIGTLAVVAMLMAAVMILAPNLQEYIVQREEIARLQQQSETTRQSIAGLEAERERWNDPAYVQAQARERLLFVMPGETSYLVAAPPVERPAAPPPQPAVEQHETPSDWLGTLGESFLHSGLPPEAEPTP